jgi:hypothetical protein
MAMIRALIGRFVLGCIKAEKDRCWRAKMRLVDPAKLTDRQLSDFMHGRAIDWSTVDPAAARLVGRS